MNSRLLERRLRCPSHEARRGRFCQWRCLRQRHARDIAKGQGRSEGDARAGIIASHDTGRVVADGIQAADRLTLRIEHLGAFVGC